MLIASTIITPAFVIPVHAQEASIADGTYDVNFFTYKTGTTETRGMANRFAQPAKLIVENGQVKLQLKIITQNSMLGTLKVPYNGKTIEMTTIEGSLETETRTVEIPVEQFNQAIPTMVEVIFPGSTTPVKQTFDLIVQSPVEQALSEQVAITAYKWNTTEPSLMQQFLVPTAKIVLAKDQSVVHITFTNKDYVNGLIINSKPAEIVAQDGETVTYGATVSNTKQLLEAEIAVNANGTPMTQKAHLHLAVKGAPIMITNPFTDISGDENETAIINLLNKGIVQSADKFNPNQKITRSQFALMIARTLNLSDATDTGFKDIERFKKTNIETYNAINALAQAGIVMKQENFNPNDNITRQHAALMIYRAMQYHVGTDALDFGNNISVYSDGSLVKSEEAQRALSFLYSSGAMTGSFDKNGNRVIQPNVALTRGHMAKILNGTLKYLGH